MCVVSTTGRFRKNFLCYWIFTKWSWRTTPRERTVFWGGGWSFRLLFIESRLAANMEFSCLYLQRVPKKWPPPNVWLWQVQTCTALHIIKRAQALMYLNYCHQILYKSIIPSSRFSIFTNRCQKVQLPAAALLACFLCALTVTSA